MKKIITTLIVLASVLSVNAQKFEQGFGVAYYQRSNICVYNRPNSGGLEARTAHKGHYECRYQMRLKYKGFFAISNTSIFMDKAKGITFAPSFADFKIDIGYKLGALKLSIGHQCLHAVESEQNINLNRISGGYNRIKLTYNIID